MTTLDRHSHGQIVVGNVARDIVCPGKIGLGQIHVVAHYHLARVGQLVGSRITQADTRLAGDQEAVLRRGRHESLRCVMQRVAVATFVHVGMEYLQATLRQDLGTMAVITIGQMPVVTMPAKLEALPEIHHVDEIVERILRPQQPEIDHVFASEQIERRQSPAHRWVRALDTHIAHAVADQLGGQMAVDLAHQFGVTIEGHEIGQQHVGRNRKQLRLLHGTCHAQPIGFIAQLLNEGIGLQQLRIVDALCLGAHRHLLSRHTRAVISRPCW